MAYGIIYHWHCAKTNMGYVGQTVNTLKGRWRGHVKSAFGDPQSKSYNWEFPKAIREHGEEAFEGRIICECETPEELSALEDKWMHELNTLWPHGYNMRDGTNFVCEQTRKLISERTKIGMSQIPPEVRVQQLENQRQGMIGHKVSEEGSRNMSRAQTRRKERGDLHSWFSAGGKSRRGSKHKEDSKELMRQNRKGKCVGDDHPMKRLEVRAKVSQGMMGHEVSEETRRKISRAKALPDAKRQAVIELLRRGVTERDISKIVGVGRTTVRRIKASTSV